MKDVKRKEGRNGHLSDVRCSRVCPSYRVDSNLQVIHRVEAMASGTVYSWVLIVSIEPLLSIESFSVSIESFFFPPELSIGTLVDILLYVLSIPKLQVELSPSTFHWEFLPKELFRSAHFQSSVRTSLILAHSFTNQLLCSSFSSSFYNRKTWRTQHLDTAARALKFLRSYVPTVEYASSGYYAQLIPKQVTLHFGGRPDKPHFNCSFCHRQPNSRYPTLRLARAGRTNQASTLPS